MRLPLRAIALAIALVAAPSCGSDETHKHETSTGDPVDSGDGRYHPPPNGQHVPEDTACSALSDAQDAKVQSLKCPITTRTCPSLLRVEFGVACMEYDDGSVKGCIDHYNAQKGCTELTEAIKECVVTAYPGTEPNGCPAQSP